MDLKRSINGNFQAPSATSTVVKSKHIRSHLSKRSDCPPSPTIDNSMVSFKQKMEQQDLGNSLLKRNIEYFNKNFGTPSLIHGVTSESTVNESDLLRPFVPSDVSTPRASCASVAADSLSDFKHQLEHSDISLSKLCDRYSMIGNNLTSDEESFATGDLAIEKIAKQEKLWLKERGLVSGGVSFHGDSLLSQLENCDITDFFKKKSELADMFLKESPEKDTQPTALVDKSASILNYTAFERAETTADIYGLLQNIGNKENVPVEIDNQRQVSSTTTVSNYQDVCDKSISSVRSVSSMQHLIGGKLPIETNRTELVWGCVQVSKKVSQSFLLRNKSANKLHFQITSSNDICYRIFVDQGSSDTVSTLPVLLYPSESRCFTIAFSPTSVGACIERLTFTPISDNLKKQQTKRQTVMLYGYGGHVHLDILSVAKDSNTKLWLALGKIDNQTELTQKFTVKNMGCLSAFASCKFTPKVLFGYSNITINPAQFIIPPKSCETVNVSFIPTKNDVRHMFVTGKDQVMDIGSIHITAGAEPLRGRMRNIYRKLEAESVDASNTLLSTLSEKFTNENIPSDILAFKETAAAMKELVQNLMQKEIVLTIERDADTTIMGRVAGLDETSFQSLSEGMITIVENTEGSPDILVEPLNVVLTPPMKVSDCILLTNHRNMPVQFYTKTSGNKNLRVSPSEGIVPPNETLPVTIACNLKEYQKENHQLHVLFYVDSKVFEVNVKVVFLKTAKK